MPATDYLYTISTEFPNAKVYIPSLTSEIEASAIVTALQDINVKVTGLDNCDIWFVDALSAGDETILDGLVAAHTGIGIVASMMGTTEVANRPFEILEVGPAWEDIGGVVTTPSFFDPDMTQLMGRILGKYKSNGVGAKVKIVETTDVGVSTDVSPELDLPNTGGTWQTFRLDTDTPPTDSVWSEFKFAGQTGGVGNVEFQFTTFSMLKVVIA